MTVTYKVQACVTLYKKYTEGAIDIDKTIEQKLEEESEDFLYLCRKYESRIRLIREDDPKTFDEELLKILTEEIKTNLLEQIYKVKNVFKECMLRKQTAACELFGFVFNPNDFSAMEILAVKISYSKN